MLFKIRFEKNHQTEDVLYHMITINWVKNEAQIRFFRTTLG